MKTKGKTNKAIPLINKEKLGKTKEDLEDLVETDPKINIELDETSMDLNSYFAPAKVPTDDKSKDVKKQILLDVLGSNDAPKEEVSPFSTVPLSLEKPVFQSKPQENDFSLTEDEFETDEFEAESISKSDYDTKKFNRPSSILDLLQNADDIAPIIPTEKEEKSKEEHLLNTKELDSKAIQKLLVIPEQNKEAWEEEEEAKKPEKEKKKAIVKKKVIGIIGLIIFILLSAGGFFYYFKFIIPLNVSNNVVSSTSNSDLQIKSVEKLKLDPNLKDKNKLSKYFDYAVKLYSKKEYKKVDILCKKILPFKWHKREIFALLGKSNDKMGETKNAIKYYKEAINQDYHKDKELPFRLLKLLFEEKKYNEIISLRKYLKSHFSSDINIQYIIAKTYYQLKEYKKAEQVLSPFNIKLMDKEILLTYGELLTINQNKKTAYRVYFLAAQNFNDINAMKTALKYAPDNKAKIDILTDLISKTKGTEECDLYKLRLAENKLKEGRKSEIYKTLASVDINKLNEKGALKYITLLTESNNTFSVIHSCENLITTKFLENYDFQEKIKNALLNNGKNEYAEKIFKNLLNDNPDNPVANYIYATISTDSEEQYKLFKKAYNLNPSFYQATMSLGKLAYDNSDWGTAKEYFKTLAETYTFKTEPRYWLTLTNIKEKRSPETFYKYKKYISNQKISVKEKYTQLITLAQYYTNNKLALEILKEMDQIPELKKLTYVQRIKTKLLYNTLKEKDFKNNMYENDIKKYKILFLLGDGKIEETMNLPTQKSEFPEFWKVFICWRKNIKSWIKNSKLLIKKHPNDKLIQISVKLWRRQITPEKAKKMLHILKDEDRPLACLIIAETFRRLRNKLKASVTYHMAIKYPQPNLYKKTASYFKNH